MNNPRQGNQDDHGRQAHLSLVSSPTFYREDSTVYFEHLPAGAMELALWLEADRMATLTAGLTPARSGPDICWGGAAGC